MQHAEFKDVKPGRWVWHKGIDKSGTPYQYGMQIGTTNTIYIAARALGRPPAIKPDKGTWLRSLGAGMGTVQLDAPRQVAESKRIATENVNARNKAKHDGWRKRVVVPAWFMEGAGLPYKYAYLELGPKCLFDHCQNTPLQRGQKHKQRAQDRAPSH